MLSLHIWVFSDIILLWFIQIIVLIVPLFIFQVLVWSAKAVLCFFQMNKSALLFTKFYSLTITILNLVAGSFTYTAYFWSSQTMTDIICLSISIWVKINSVLSIALKNIFRDLFGFLCRCFTGTVNNNILLFHIVK